MAPKAKEIASPKIISLSEKKGHRQRKPYVPMTGNPENGDYGDWYRHLQEGQVIQMPDKTKKS